MMANLERELSQKGDVGSAMSGPGKSGKEYGVSDEEYKNLSRKTREEAKQQKQKK